MSAADEAVVRRFYEQMCNERKNDLAAELFAAGHVMHDPQVPTPDGPEGMVATDDDRKRVEQALAKLTEKLGLASASDLSNSSLPPPPTTGDS